MADDFTCILRDEFKRFIEELSYEELRQGIFTEELEVADRLLLIQTAFHTPLGLSCTTNLYATLFLRTRIIN